MARKPYFNEDDLPEDERELRRQFLTSLGLDPDVGWKYYDLNDWEVMHDVCTAARYKNVSEEVITAQTKWWFEGQANLLTRRKQDRIARVKDAAINGTELDLSPNDIADAKLYVRMRAIAQLPQSIDTLIEVRDDPNAKASERAKAAGTLVAYAVGPPEAPNSIPFPADLSRLSPTEIIDAIIEAVASGACSESFARTIVSLLGDKVQAQKLEDMVVAQARTINGNPSPPVGHVNGTVLTLPVRPWPPEQPPTSHAPVATG